ncbi:MAG: anti-sigma factor family protein [bacterium]
MIAKKYFELINKEIDGVNSPDDTKQLKEYLAQHPEAEHFYQALTKLSKMLLQVHDVNPSPNLKKRIFNAIPWDKYAIKKQRRKSLKSLLPAPRFRLSFNYVYAFSAGLILGVIGYALLSHSLQKNARLDFSHLTGTLLVDESLNSLEPVERVSLDLPGTSGTFELKRGRGVIVAELRLNAHQQVENVLAFDQHDLAFAGFGHMTGGPVAVDADSGHVRLSYRGDQEYILVFNDKLSTPTPLNLKIFSAGILRYEKTFLTEEPEAGKSNRMN